VSFHSIWTMKNNVVDWVYKVNDEIVDEETFIRLSKEHDAWVKELELKNLELAKALAKPEKVRKSRKK